MEPKDKSVDAVRRSGPTRSGVGPAPRFLRSLASSRDWPAGLLAPRRQPRPGRVSPSQPDCLPPGQVVEPVYAGARKRAFALRAGESARRGSGRQRREERFMMGAVPILSPGGVLVERRWAVHIAYFTPG